MNDLDKYVSDREGTYQQAQLQRWIDRMRNKPFWIEDSETHKQAFVNLNGDCCAWHIFGEPERELNGKRIKTPCFDFQFAIINDLNNGIKRIAINKSSALGITELLTVRWIAYKCLVNEEWRNQKVAILNSPRVNMSVDIINRIKRIFPDVQFKERESKIILNGCTIEAYPSHLGLNALRGIDRLACCVLEEFDHFNSLEEQQQTRNLAERNIAKNNSVILIISTPNRPDFELAKLEREHGSGIYKMIRLPYTVAIDKMFDRNFLNEQMKSPGFQQEYNLMFQGHVGNLLDPGAMDNCIYDYNLDEINPFSSKVAGLDFGGGSSNTSLVICESIDGIVRVVYQKEWNRPMLDQVLGEIHNILNRYSVDRVMIDGSSPEIVRQIMSFYGDNTYYLKQIKYYESQHIDWRNIYHVQPINFQKEARDCLSNLKMLIDSGVIEIHKSMTDIITGLRTAYDSGNFELDKSKTLFHDSIDALRICTKNYHATRKRDKEKVLMQREEPEIFPNNPIEKAKYERRKVAALLLGYESPGHIENEYLNKDNMLTCDECNTNTGAPLTFDEESGFYCFYCGRCNALIKRRPGPPKTMPIATAKESYIVEDIANKPRSTFVISHKGRRVRKNTLDGTTEDYDDLSLFLGYRPASVSISSYDDTQRSN